MKWVSRISPSGAAASVIALPAKLFALHGRFCASDDDDLAIAVRRALNAESKTVEKLGKGWMTSLNTSSGTRARMASVACWSHSPDSAPRAYRRSTGHHR